MPEAQENWIAKRVNAAQNSYSVSEAIASAIKAELQTRMNERSLSAGELSALANKLLDAVLRHSDKEVAT